MLEDDVIFQDKYLVGRKVGSGSFGAILLGTDLETGKYVAIKFVRFQRVNQTRHIGKNLNKQGSHSTLRSQGVEKSTLRKQPRL
jgi:serine/threonine protein kinase